MKLGKHSTAEQAAASVDLAGKNIVITGANSGIGLESAKVLAKHGANVIMACRDPVKSDKALQEVLAYCGNNNVRTMALDLSDLDSVRKFVVDYNTATANAPINVLLNNAGVMATPYGKTKQGFELQFGTNHLGHFLLTNLLLPNLIAAGPSRVVNVSSSAHGLHGMNWSDINWEKKYKKWGAYGQSKTANILFSKELSHRYAKDGVFSNAIHPGVISNTNLNNNVHGPGAFLLAMFSKMTGKDIPAGASTQVYVAVAPELEGVHSKYFEDCHEKTPSKHANNAEDASKLWEYSERAVGLVM